MKKLDIMNRKEPGKWVINDGKVERIEEVIPTGLVVEKEEKKKVEEIMKEKKGAKAEVDGKKLRYDEVKEEWKEEKPKKKRSKKK